MRRSHLGDRMGFAALLLMAAGAVGCGRGERPDTEHAPGAGVTRVEVVRPERATIRRGKGSEVRRLGPVTVASSSAEYTSRDMACGLSWATLVKGANSSPMAWA